MAKAIRFGDLVREAGRPEAVTLWIDPKKDPVFLKAVKENRVVTIHSHPAGHRKDYGEIGFHEERGATYLVFPRKLPKKEQSRIVGINYQLAEDAPVKGALAKPTSRKKTGGRKPGKQLVRVESAAVKRKTRPAKPEPKDFNIIVRRTAVIEDLERVKAVNEDEARALALKSIKHKRFVLSRAVQRDEIVSASEPA